MTEFEKKMLMFMEQHIYLMKELAVAVSVDVDASTELFDGVLEDIKDFHTPTIGE